MNQNELRIQIVGTLNVGKSIGEINTAIKGLEKRINALKLRVEVPRDFQKTVNDLVKATNKLKAVQEAQNRVVKEEIHEFEELDGTVKKYIKTVHANGEVSERVINKSSEKRKALQKEADATKSLEEAIKDLNRAELDRIKVQQNNKGNVTGITTTRRDGATTVTQRLSGAKELISQTTTYNLEEQKKLAEAQDELIKKLDFYGAKKDYIATRERINNAKTIKELRDIESELQKRYNLEQKIAEFQRSAALKVREMEMKYGSAALRDAGVYKLLNDARLLNADMREVERIMKDFNFQLKEVDTNLRASGAGAVTFGKQLEIAFQRVPIWMAAMTAFYGTLRAFQDMLAQITEIDTQLTEMARVMDDFSAPVVLRESVQIASDLGQKITEVNQAMISAARFGQRGQDLFGLTRAAVLASTISDLTADEALDNLSSVITQFNMSASEAVRIVDKLNEVDNNYVVSTMDLSQSIAKAGAVADTFGASLDRLLGYTVAISQGTRESGNVIGNSLKSIISRITTLNDSIDSLGAIGVEVFDSMTGDVRAVDDILDDLADKWDSLTASQQQNLGLTIAGRHHVSRFLALMNNYGTVSEVVETSINSVGSAMEENIRYQQSLEAELNKLANAWTNLSVTVGESGLKEAFSTVINLGTDLLNIATSLVQGIDTLGNRFSWLSNILEAFGPRNIKIIESMRELTQILSFGADKINQFFGADSVDSLIQDNSQVFINEANTLDDTVQRLNELIPRYHELKNATELSRLEQRELNNILKEVHMLAPQLISEYDEYGNALDINTGKVDEHVKQLEELRRGYLEQAKAINTDKIRELRNELEQVGRNIERIGTGSNFDKKGFDKLLIEQHDLNAQIESLEQLNERIDDLIENKQRASATFQQSSAYIDEETGELYENTTALNYLIETLNNSYTETVSEVANLASAYETLNEGKQLSYNTILNLIDKYPELASYLAETNDLTFKKGELIKEVAERQRQFRLQETQDALDSINTTRDELESKRQLYLEYYKKLSGVGMAFDIDTSDIAFTMADQQLLDELNQKATELEAKIAVLSQPLSFFTGSSASSSSRNKGKSAAEIAEEEAKKEAEARRKAYQENVAHFQYLVELQEWSTEAQIAGWQRIAERHKQYLNEDKEAYRQYNLTMKRLRDELNKEIEDKEEQRYRNSMKFIENEKYFNRMTLEQELIALQRVYEAHKHNTERRKELEREIYRVQKEIRERNEREAKDAAERQKRAEEERIKRAKEIADQVIDAMKEALKAQRDADLDNIKRLMDLENERHRQRIEHIEEEYRRFEKAINDQLRLIDQEADEEDYNERLAKMQQEAQRIRSQINELALDDSYEAQARRLELEEELSERTEEIEKFMKNRTKELRKDALREELQRKKEETDAAKKAEDEKYNHTKKRLEDMRRQRELYWQGVINNDQRWMQIQDSIVNGHLDGIKNELSSFKDAVASIASVIGEEIQKNIIYQLEQASAALSGLSGHSSSIAPRKPGNVILKNPITGKPVEVRPGSFLIGRWEKYHSGGEVGTKTTVGQTLHRLFNLGSDEIPAILKQGELVIKNPTSALTNLMNSIAKPNVSDIRSQATGDTNYYNINIKIDKVNGDVDGGKQVFRTFVKELQKRGK